MTPRKPALGKSLAEVNPALAKEWHPEKNGDLTPSDVINGGNTRYWWLASCGHEWRADIKHRGGRGQGCARCAKTATSLAERRLFASCSWIEGSQNGHKFDGTSMGNGQRMTADIFGQYRERNIVVEYDGSYWHREKHQKDFLKTFGLIGMNNIVVRIREDDLALLPPVRGLMQLQFNAVTGTDESTAPAYAALSDRIRAAADDFIDDGDPDAPGLGEFMRAPIEDEV